MPRQTQKTKKRSTRLAPLARKKPFMSVASHHMRTPLTTVRWYVELLRSKEAGTLNRQQADVLEEIEAGVQDIILVLNELLGTPASAEDRMMASANAAPRASARSKKKARRTRKTV